MIIIDMKNFLLLFVLIFFMSDSVCAKRRISIDTFFVNVSPWIVCGRHHFPERDFYIILDNKGNSKFIQKFPDSADVDSSFKQFSCDFKYKRIFFRRRTILLDSTSCDQKGHFYMSDSILKRSPYILNNCPYQSFFYSLGKNALIRRKRDKLFVFWKDYALDNSEDPLYLVLKKNGKFTLSYVVATDNKEFYELIKGDNNTYVKSLGKKAAKEKFRKNGVNYYFEYVEQ